MTERTPSLRLGYASVAKRSFSEAKPLLRGLIESVVLLLLMRTVEVVFFHEGFFATLTEHPFWLVVLLASVQHGLFVGVATAGLSALMMDWPARPLGVDITAHYMTIAILPLQWLVVALCIGAFRQSQLQAERTLRSERDELTVMNDALATEVRRLDTAFERLELEAVTGPPEQVRLEVLMSAITALCDAAPNDLHARFDEAASLSTKLQARLLLHVEGQGFIDGSGAAPLSGLALPLQRDDPLVSTARLARRAVVVPASNRGGNSGCPLVVSGIHPNEGQSTAGIVVFAAEHHDEAEAVVPLADILTDAVELAISRTFDRESETGSIPMKCVLNG